MHIVYEETKRMLRGMLPLALVTFGVFALCGQGIACLLYTSPSPRDA